jgi:hypothetical protein
VSGADQAYGQEYFDDAQQCLEYVRAFITGLDPSNHWPHKPNLVRVIRNCLTKLDVADKALGVAYDKEQARKPKRKRKQKP